jgi:hypothetical protein
MTDASAALSDISDTGAGCRIAPKPADKLAKSDNPTLSDSLRDELAEKRGWSPAGWRERMRRAEAANSERQVAEDAEAKRQARAAWLLNAMMEAEAALAEPDTDLDHERAEMAAAMAAKAEGER